LLGFVCGGKSGGGGFGGNAARMAWIGLNSLESNLVSSIVNNRMNSSISEATRQNSSSQRLVHAKLCRILHPA